MTFQISSCTKRRKQKEKKERKIECSLLVKSVVFVSLWTQVKAICEFSKSKSISKEYTSGKQKIILLLKALRLRENKTKKKKESAGLASSHSSKQM